MTRFNPEKYYRISLDTTKHVHLGMTKKFRIKDDETMASDERELILKKAIENGLIKKVAGIVFTMYEVVNTSVGDYLKEEE